MRLTAHRCLLLAALAAAVVTAGAATHGQQTGAKPAPAAAPRPGLVFDRYHPPQDVNAALAAMNRANPATTALHTIAVSPGGTDVTLIEIGPDVGKKPH